MITSNQLRAARALLNIDQRETAELADLSVPTIQRMEASDGVIRGNVDSLMKLVAALDNAGSELINPGSTSVTGGRGVRLKEHIANPTIIRGRQPKSTPSSRGQWPLGECRTFTKLRSYKDADLIAGFIVVGAALVTQSKYQPPFRVHALLRVTTRRSVSFLTGSISRFAKPAAGRPPSASPR